jgi:hypothetical protein
MSEVKTKTCEFEGCTNTIEFSGRGRPPKYCEDHKGAKKTEAKPVNESPRPRPGQKSEPAAPAPRARPGAKTADPTPSPRPRPAAKASGKDSEPVAAAPRARPGTPPPAIGAADTKSRAKAESAANRNVGLVEEMGGVPMGVGGRPMARLRMTASELVPTGQYANVSVGPAMIDVYVDLDRDINGSYFTEDERNVMVTALNELAEVVERDVVAVQRSLVMESMQEQLAS